MVPFFIDGFDEDRHSFYGKLYRLDEEDPEDLADLTEDDLADRDVDPGLLSRCRVYGFPKGLYYFDPECADSHCYRAEALFKDSINDLMVLLYDPSGD